jgi:sirohydrochlorin cobaltochelatase
MLKTIEQVFKGQIAGTCSIGQVLIRKTSNGQFILSHRDEEADGRGQVFRNPEDAVEIAKYDEEGNYRPLKTAPNLRRGWRLEIADLAGLRRALDYFYPGRLAVFSAWKANHLVTTTLRDTLNRQSGMYRVAAKISDQQINELVGNFCRSSDGCLRTILWKRDASSAPASTHLPPEKFEPSHDQTGSGATVIPLLCQEPCNLLVNECRKTVKMEGAAPSAPE